MLVHIYYYNLNYNTPGVVINEKNNIKCHTIYTMFDADEAGRKAEHSAHRLLTDTFIINEETKLQLPDGLDPGDLSATDIKHIKENIYGTTITQDSSS